MVDGDELPTIGEALSNWLGVQLPSIPLPQTVKNFDKAIAKVVLAAGENFEAWIKGNTAKAKAQSKIDLADLVRTEDEKRKLTNRLAATKAALEDMRVNPPGADATSEIEDDWLNLFVRLAEDKSSEELQLLFGRILIWGDQETRIIFPPHFTLHVDDLEARSQIPHKPSSIRNRWHGHSFSERKRRETN